MQCEFLLDDSGLDVAPDEALEAVGALVDALPQGAVHDPQRVRQVLVGVAVALSQGDGIRVRVDLQQVDRWRSWGREEVARCECDHGHH